MDPRRGHLTAHADATTEPAFSGDAIDVYHFAARVPGWVDLKFDKATVGTYPGPELLRRLGSIEPGRPGRQRTRRSARAWMPTTPHRGVDSACRPAV